MLIDIICKRKRLRRRCLDTWTAVRTQQPPFFRGNPDSSFLRDGNVAAVHRIASAIHRSVAHSIAIQNVAGHYLFERVFFGTNFGLAADYRRTKSRGFDRCSFCDYGFGTGGRTTWAWSRAGPTRATAASASGSNGYRHQQNCEGKEKSNCRQPHCGLTKRLWHLAFCGLCFYQLYGWVFRTKHSFEESIFWSNYVIGENDVKPLSVLPEHVLSKFHGNPSIAHSPLVLLLVKRKYFLERRIWRILFPSLQREMSTQKAARQWKSRTHWRSHPLAISPLVRHQ